MQIAESIGNLNKGTKLDIPKSEIRVKEDSTPAGYETSSWIYRNRWYFSAICLAAVLVIVMSTLVGWAFGAFV